MNNLQVLHCCTQSLSLAPKKMKHKLPFNFNCNPQWGFTCRPLTRKAKGGGKMPGFLKANLFWMVETLLELPPLQRGREQWIDGETFSTARDNLVGGKGIQLNIQCCGVCGSVGEGSLPLIAFLICSGTERHQTTKNIHHSLSTRK